MRRCRTLTSGLLLMVCFYIFIIGCGPTVIVRQPPAPKTEVRPAKPFSNAVWVNGHWKWSGGGYVWVPGHWAKPKPGKIWVPGHWQKRPRGWVWVKGHWR